MEAEARSEPPEALAIPGLGAQVRSTVGRLYRRFRNERPEGGLGDAALDVLNCADGKEGRPVSGD